MDSDRGRSWRKKGSSEGHFGCWGLGVVDPRLLVLTSLRLVAEHLGRGDNRHLESRVIGKESAQCSHGPSVDTGQVPNQLAILALAFDPSIDSVEIWSSKVELLLATWPPLITELATRLMLGCKGTAYQKLQLHCTEPPKGIRKLVELVGGRGDRFPLKRSMRFVEEGRVQKQNPDEISDSFISRSDVAWTELEAKGINLSEIRSYILLRGSRLSSEDKKRVLVEPGAESNGALKLTH